MRAPARTNAHGQGLAQVVLFKPGGKYYTEEWWVIPDGVPSESESGRTRRTIGPYDMEYSPDWRCPGPDWHVLIPTQEPWGFPFLFPGDTRGRVTRRVGDDQ